MGTKLYQLELDQKNIDCGMSYVIELEQGGFFIIDGGYFTEGEQDRLYSFLKQRSENDKIHIKGWFFSHAHSDHIGNFVNFLKKYSSETIIDNLYYNFQPVDLSGVSGDWRSSDESVLKEFWQELDNHKNIPSVIIKTGQIFNIDELKFEVLYTQEDIYPNEQAIFNDYSAVLMMSVKGQKFLWLGDIYEVASECLMKHPEKLRCDFVQISHHGFNGATPELYKATNASVALLPSPDYRVENNHWRPSNQYIFDESNMELYISGVDGTVEFKLPYKPNSAVKFGKAL